MARRLVGYDRFEGVAAARVLARLFDVARLYVNFFQPSFKLRDKTRVGAKGNPAGPPATPCKRLLAHREVNKETMAQLRQRRAELDPVKLIMGLRAAQAELVRLTGDGGAEEPTTTDMESFLAQLPELWRTGDSRPIPSPRGVHPQVAASSRSIRG